VMKRSCSLFLFLFVHFHGMHHYKIADSLLFDYTDNLREIHQCNLFSDFNVNSLCSPL